MNEASNNEQSIALPVKFRKPEKNIVGRRFGKLQIVNFSHIGKHYVKFWDCICDCGASKKISGDNLIKGRTKSCGCLNRELKPTFKHGHHPRTGASPEYAVWRSMKRRVLNPKCEHFDRYGGRGIKCCDRWLNSFEDFFADMGKRPSLLHSIDRINNDGDYEPNNCRWATKKQQARSRCSSRYIEYNGETKTLAEWAEGANMDLRALWQRLKRGWSMEKSLTTSLDRKKQP